MNNGFQPTDWSSQAPQRSPFRRWLTDRGSLTRRIRQRCPAFSVRTVRQRLSRAGRHDALASGARKGMPILQREVFLHCGVTPVVYASSIVPLASLQGAWQRLGRLGNRSLGETLFGNPQVRRAPLRYKKLNAHHRLYRRACAGLTQRPSHLWARRSVFRLNGRPILVTEVFLPAILELPL
ncbi:MAG: chorismate--pyruvate lyase family protein [Burkholderiales bacterium]